jgi:hypothetical protein
VKRLPRCSTDGYDSAVEVRTTLDALISALRDYGEDAVADLVPGFDEAQLHRVWVLAGRNSTLDAGKKAGGMMLAKALALAAVEVAEGAARPLQQSRRVFRR